LFDAQREVDMTVGYLLDLLIINEVRKEKLADTLELDIVHDLNKQNGFLLKEIGKYLIDVSEGRRPGIFSKHKNYDKDVNEEKNHNLIKVLWGLYQRHSELWDLEDERRDTENNSDTERLAAADLVSQTNKKRNDLVEQIDTIVNADLKKIKIWGELID
tara:strand:+ start:10 stop:486 length:477 start_codon:yes stop_codon:yes gene_type:complete